MSKDQYCNCIDHKKVEAHAGSQKYYICTLKLGGCGKEINNSPRTYRASDVTIKIGDEEIGSFDPFNITIDKAEEEDLDKLAESFSVKRDKKIPADELKAQWNPNANNGKGEVKYKQPIICDDCEGTRKNVLQCFSGLLEEVPCARCSGHGYLNDVRPKWDPLKGYVQCNECKIHFKTGYTLEIYPSGHTEATCHRCGGKYDDNVPADVEVKRDLNDIRCQTCLGSGFVAKLYPSGHTEVTCEECDGNGHL